MLLRELLVYMYVGGALGGALLLKAQVCAAGDELYTHMPHGICIVAQYVEVYPHLATREFVSNFRFSRKFCLSVATCESRFRWIFEEIFDKFG